MINPRTLVYLLRLAPEMADAIAKLVRALLADDPVAERRAIELARRAAFLARQKKAPAPKPPAPKPR